MCCHERKAINWTGMAMVRIRSYPYRISGHLEKKRTMMWQNQQNYLSHKPGHLLISFHFSKWLAVFMWIAMTDNSSWLI